MSHGRIHAFESGKTGLKPVKNVSTRLTSGSSLFSTSRYVLQVPKGEVGGFSRGSWRTQRDDVQGMVRKC